MTKYLPDTVGLVGFAALGYGIYNKFGLGWALIACGSLCLIYAYRASK